MPDDNKSNRGNRESEAATIVITRAGRVRVASRKAIAAGLRASDRERDAKGRFESDDSESGSSSSRGEGSRGSGGSSEGFPKKKK